MICKYKFKDFKCKETVDTDQEYCILHREFPEDPQSIEFSAMLSAKYDKVQEKISKRDYNFVGALLKGIIFSRQEIDLTVSLGSSRPLDFRDSRIKNNVYFIKSILKNGNILFTFAQIDGELAFNEAIIKGDIWLKDSKIGLPISFDKADIQGNIYFDNAIINHEISFDDANIKGNIYFKKSTIDGTISLDFKELSGELVFEDAFFKSPWAQEIACRKARRIYEDKGDKNKADDYFYREMEGKRKQNPWYIRYPEFLFLQLIFGYGVHPWWLMYWWLLIVSLFSNIYLIGNGIEGIEHWYDYVKISFAIAIAPGYIAAIINPASAGYKLIPIYQAIAIIETIIGTFLWAGFIATFARKYMR